MKRIYAIVFITSTLVFLSQNTFGLTYQEIMQNNLINALKQGKVKKIKELVQKGANINKKNMYGESYLDTCSFTGCSIDVIKYLVEEKRFNINQENNDGRTALFQACDGGSLEIVKYLIEQGSRIDKRDTISVTPLFLSAVKGHLDVTKFLIKKGAKINIQENRGYTPLHLAVSGRHLNIVRFLIESGAKIDIKDKNGQTPNDIATGEIKKYLENIPNKK